LKCFLDKIEGFSNNYAYQTGKEKAVGICPQVISLALQHLIPEANEHEKETTTQNFSNHKRVSVRAEPGTKLIYKSKIVTPS
jgi:hypothetical protein